MAAALSFKELFDPNFLESLNHLRIVSRRVARGGAFGEQRSHDLGSGLEFRDFRPYSPGDDLRAIDWNIYRRLGRVFLRLFEELEDLPVYLLPDVSQSAFVESPPRARAGLRAAMALTAISLGQHDSVGLFPFCDELKTVMRPRSGKASLMRFADELAKLEPGNATDFGQSMKRFNALGLREGLAVIISDFFDPAGLEAVVKSLKGIRHRLLLIQLFRASDRQPSLAGDVQLRDCETGDAQDVSITKQALEKYREAYDAFQLGLTQFVRSRGAGLLTLDVDREVVPQLATLFETGSYEV